MNVTAILMGDPEAAIYRRQPTSAEMRERSSVASHDYYISGREYAIPCQKQLEAMKVRGKIEGLTRAQAVHRCTWLRKLGRRGRYRYQLDGTYTVERVK